MNFSLLKSFNPRRDWQIMLAVWLLLLVAVIVWRGYGIIDFQMEFEVATDPDINTKTINEEQLTDVADAIRNRAIELEQLKQAPIPKT